MNKKRVYRLLLTAIIIIAKYLNLVRHNAISNKFLRRSMKIGNRKIRGLLSRASWIDAESFLLFFLRRALKGYSRLSAGAKLAPSRDGSRSRGLTGHRHCTNTSFPPTTLSAREKERCRATRLAADSIRTYNDSELQLLVTIFAPPLPSLPARSHTAVTRNFRLIHPTFAERSGRRRGVTRRENLIRQTGSKLSHFAVIAARLLLLPPPSGCWLLLRPTMECSQRNEN